MKKLFRFSALAAVATLTAPSFMLAANANSTRTKVETNLLANGPSAPMPRVPTVPRSSAVIALEANGPSAPMPRVPTVPKQSGDITLVMAV
jgi:hypothetical protein